MIYFDTFQLKKVFGWSLTTSETPSICIHCYSQYVITNTNIVLEKMFFFALPLDPRNIQANLTN